MEFKPPPTSEVHLIPIGTPRIGPVKLNMLVVARFLKRRSMRVVRKDEVELRIRRSDIFHHFSDPFATFLNTTISPIRASGLFRRLTSSSLPQRSLNPSPRAANTEVIIIPLIHRRKSEISVHFDKKGSNKRTQSRPTRIESTSRQKARPVAAVIVVCPGHVSRDPLHDIDRGWREPRL